MLGGIYENCIGTEEAATTLRYWQEMGYREAGRGQFSAEQALALYGYNSPLLSIRLQNGESANHGNLRVMVWDRLKNEGLGFARPLEVGSRWFAQMVKDILVVQDAFADDKAASGEWLFSEPARAIINTGKTASGLYDRFVGVREMFVIGKETRQAFFQRYGYTRPGYGNIHPDSPMGVSEGTHSSFVTPDHTSSHFYSEVFGLKPLSSGNKSGDKPASRQTLMMQEGEDYFWLTGFESQKTQVGLFQVYSPLYPVPDKRELAQPGSLGISLFTYRADNLAEFHAQVSASAAYDIRPIQPNEFGEPSFGFFAPDGMYWVILDSPPPYPIPHY